MTTSEVHQQVFSEKFSAFCKKWSNLLNLPGWKIDYQMVDVFDDDATIHAQCAVNTHLGHRATITFATRMGLEDDREREDLVVHEHLHIILDELGQFVYQYLPSEHHTYFTRLVEVAVSDLARVMVGLNENEKQRSFADER